MEREFKCIDCGKEVYKDKATIRCKSCENKRRWKSKEYIGLREKITKSIRKSPKRFKNQAVRDKISKAKIGTKNPFLSEWNKQHNPLVSKELLAKRFKELNKDMDFQKKRLKSLCKRPTKPEQKIIDLIIKYNLKIMYVGDGSFFVKGLNPDFISTEDKKIIEVFGRYWHETYHDVDWKRTVDGRTKIFKEEGYEILIIWDDEIKELSESDVLNKINKFIQAEGK